MKQYKDLIQKILDDGSDRPDRTGVGCRSIFGHQLKFDLRDGFPLVSLKKTIWRSAFYEMIWFLRGNTNIKYLTDRKINIWDQWADEFGSIGPGYGESLRKWAYYYIPNPEEEDGWNYGMQSKDIDQFKDFVEGLQKNPFGRRHIMTTWHPGRLEEMALPPCHGLLLQGFVSSDRGFDLHVGCRSSDCFVGLPWNIAEWAFFMHLVGNLCNLNPRYLIMSLGDAHIYLNHLDGVDKMMKREPIIQNPTIVFKKDIESIQDVQNLEIDTDIEIENYKYHPFIKVPIAV